jgi:hypothetical protein
MINLMHADGVIEPKTGFAFARISVLNGSDAGTFHHGNGHGRWQDRGTRRTAVRIATCRTGRGADEARTDRRPMQAAAQAGRTIRIARIIQAFRRLKTAHEIVLVEGAGGLLVPLNRRETMLDLMRALALPVVVAARPGLGTLNHTLLTLRELRRQGLRVLGVILVCTRPRRWGGIEQSNLETIQRLGQAPVHRLGYRPSLATMNRPPKKLPAQAVRQASRWLAAWRV